MTTAHGSNLTALEDHLKAWREYAYAAALTHVDEAHGWYHADRSDGAPHVDDQHREAHARMGEVAK